MKHFRIHIKEANRVIKLVNGETRRTPTRFVIKESEKAQYDAMFKRLEIRDFSTEDVSEDDYNNARSRRLTKSKYSLRRPTSDMNMNLDLKG